MEFKKESITFEGGEIFPVPIRTALRYFEHIDFPFYISSDAKKFFKIRHDVKIVQEMMEKYRDKGVKDIFLCEADYMNFLAKIRQGLAQKLFDPSTVNQVEGKNMATLNEAYLMLRNALSNFGVTPVVLDLAEEVNRASISLLRQTPNIFLLFKRFRQDCQEGFLDSLLTSFIVTILIEQTTWKTRPIVEKLTLATLLLDINLHKNEYQEMKSGFEGNIGLSEKVRAHPLEMVKNLSKFREQFPKEVLECIEFHHEMPDGSGYPKGVDYSRINKLPACLIVGQYMGQLLKKNDFDFQRKEAIGEELKRKFEYPTFNEFLDVLIDLMT
ncbi:MAG: hypothetical protein Fur0010_02760 [Bdellovibrio sp.]